MAKKNNAKYEGRRRYIDAKTGEVVTANQIVQNVSYRHFWKANIRSLVVQLGMVTSRSLNVLEYLLSHLSPSDNRLIMTNKQIAHKLHIGYATVARTLAFLNNRDVIRRKPNVIMFNPKLMLHGSENKRDYLMIVFNKMPEKQQKSNPAKKDLHIYRTRLEARKHNGYYQPSMFKQKKSARKRYKAN